MKLLFAALAFVGSSALACPADGAKDAQAPAQEKSMAAAKAPAPATKAAVSKKAQTTKVAAEATRKSSL
jgi:hypothetical protein